MFFRKREQESENGLGLRSQWSPTGLLPGSFPLLPMCSGELQGGAEWEDFSEGKNPSLRATHRRSLPDELDGELLAVKERGLIWWELGIQIKNLLF